MPDGAAAWRPMTFDRNLIMRWILSGRVIVEDNRIPLFLITL